MARNNSSRRKMPINFSSWRIITRRGSSSFTISKVKSIDAMILAKQPYNINIFINYQMNTVAIYTVS